MWSNWLDKFKRLRALDKQCRMYGAGEHHYQLNAPLSMEALQLQEMRLGFALPEPLRAFYTEISNGGVGAANGLFPAESLEGYRPTEPYPGVEFYRQLAADLGDPPDESGYFEIPNGNFTGLLPIVHLGCGHEACLVTSGKIDKGWVTVSADGCVYESNETMVDWFEACLDGEIERFEVLQELMFAGRSYEQIDSEMRARFGDYQVGDRIASFADVPFPEELFGTVHWKIHHGATQFPWYQNVLKEWQAKNL